MATVLVIDDEENIRDVITQQLRQRGHQILSYPDVAPALEAVDFAGVDLILMDPIKPTLGKWTITTLRRPGNAAPMLVLTGKPEAEEPLISIEANRVLDKPVRLMELLSAVEVLLPSN